MCKHIDRASQIEYVQKLSNIENIIMHFAECILQNECQCKTFIYVCALLYPTLIGYIMLEAHI